MDAPPDKEPCEPFVRIGDWMRKAGVRVPEIFEQKVEDDFSSFPISETSIIRRLWREPNAIVFMTWRSINPSFQNRLATASSNFGL